MKPELIERRVLGAVRLLDAATGLRVETPLRLATPEAPTARLTRNRSGDYVIWAVPGLEAHTTAFMQPPAQPALGSVELTLLVSDPAGAYLEQRVVIELPRAARPEAADSIFQVMERPLYPSPAARTAASWALVRASVKRAGTEEPLAGALIRVLSGNGLSNQVMARGLADARGEALVAVPGIQVTNWNQAPGPGPVLTLRVPVTLQVIFDPAARGAPHPQDLEERRAQLAHSEAQAELASGQTIIRTLSVNLP